MPVQDFKPYTSPGLPGEEYGIATTNSQRMSYRIVGTKYSNCRYGGPAARKTVTVGGYPGWLGQVTCSLDIDSEKRLYFLLGIIMREAKLEACNKPSDGSICFSDGDIVSVLMSGAILIELSTDIDSETIACHLSESTFGQPGGDYLKLENVVALKYPAKAGEVIPVMLSQYPNSDPTSAN